MDTFVIGQNLKRHVTFTTASPEVLSQRTGVGLLKRVRARLSLLG
jgi:hypothetical protein